jgi:potassium-transporting ATPase KdpC subunit
MRTHLYRAVILTVVLLVICGVGYNAAGWALSQVLFHHQANGSITANGSTLIGQPWNDQTSVNPRWFNGRPDADNPLELELPGHAPVAGSSGAANLGPKSLKLVAAVKVLIAEWHRVGVDPTPDLVTTSASGLDPDISPLDAMVQVPMLHRTYRYLSVSTLTQLVRSHTVGPQLGFLGSSYVNVLELNEALAALRR